MLQNSLTSKKMHRKPRVMSCHMLASYFGGDASMDINGVLLPIISLDMAQDVDHAKRKR
jgi:hypothetical protein